MRSKTPLLGAILIVAGTAVGAGMLVLPIATAFFGFIPSCLLLTFLWWVMYRAALLTVEAQLHYGQPLTLAALAHRTFGRPASICVMLAFLVLFYCLLAAYIAGGVNLLQGGISSFGVSMPSNTLLALGLGGGFALVLYFRTAAVDWVNRALFIFKIILFVVLLFLLGMHFQPAFLYDYGEDLQSGVWTLIPLMFTAFGFHGSIHVIVGYVGPHPAQLKAVFAIGSFIPLVFYVLWLVFTLGVIPLRGEMGFEAIIASDNQLSSFLDHLCILNENSFISLFAPTFSFLAIGTSFLGVGIGLFEFIQERLKSTSLKVGRLPVLFLTLFFPVVFALFYPGGFQEALRYSAIALSFISILMPVLIIGRLRQDQRVAPENLQGRSVERLGGSFSILVTLFVIGIGVIILHLLNVLGN